MSTTETNEYKSIEVDGRTIIMDETQAFRILHAMREAFGWVGTEFCESDIRECIANRRDADDKEPYTEDEMAEAVATIMDSYSWTNDMEEWMCKEGFEIINDAIFDEIEWPEVKAPKGEEDD